MGSSPPFEKSTLETFSESVRGTVISPEDEGYDEARSVWNELIDKYPAAIVQCSGVADVIAAVDFAREHNRLLAVRSGGHDYAGNSVCNGGLVIDLSDLNGIRVDPKRNLAQVEPGVTWEEFYHETEPFGLATPGGINGVGIAGFTLGGGIGYLSRKYGFTIDNLRSVDLVTADGEFVHASKDEYPDLFWALRGGGGNFGIVTSFEYELHEIGSELLVGHTVFSLDQATQVLKAFRAFVTDAPDEFMCYAAFTELPDRPPYPAEYHGAPALVFTAVYAGDQSEGKDVLGTVEEFGNPVFSHMGGQSLTQIADATESGIFQTERIYSKSQYLTELSDQAIETIIQHIQDIPGEATMVGIGTMGGAINRIDPSATAFPHRDKQFEFSIWPAWSDPDLDDEILDWAREFHDDLAQHSAEGVYVNLLSHDERDRLQDAYADNLSRLRDVKAAWDPENLFRRNHNIEPSA